MAGSLWAPYNFFKSTAIYYLGKNSPSLTEVEPTTYHTKLEERGCRGYMKSRTKVRGGTHKPGGGRVPEKVLHGEALPRGPNPYLFICLQPEKVPVLDGTSPYSPL